MKNFLFFVLGFTFFPYCFLQAWDVNFVEDAPNFCLESPTSYIVNNSNPQIEIKFEITCNPPILPLFCNDSFSVDIYLQGNPRRLL